MTALSGQKSGNQDLFSELILEPKTRCFGGGGPTPLGSELNFGGRKMLLNFRNPNSSFYSRFLFTLWRKRLAS